MALLAVAAVLVAGCGSSPSKGSAPAGSLTVYTSLPREGLSAREADAVAAGERLALADARGRVNGVPVRLVELDSSMPGGVAWDPAAVEANARRAAGDQSAIAYIGELDQGGSAVSVPVTSAATLLQVSPADGLSGLTRTDPEQEESGPARYYVRGLRNFLRLVPRDDRQAAALVSWARAGGARRIAIVRDDGLFGREVAFEAGEAAGRAHLPVTTVEEARRDAADYADLAHDLAAKPADAVIYTGLGGPTGRRVLAAIGSALPRARIYAADGLTPQDAAAAPRAPGLDVLRPALPADSYGADAERTLRRLRALRGGPIVPEALLGYESMRVVLDALRAAGARGGADRDRVIRAALAPRRRAGTVLGDYEIEPGGDVAPPRFAGYRRVAGDLEFGGIRLP